MTPSQSNLPFAATIQERFEEFDARHPENDRRGSKRKNVLIIEALRLQLLSVEAESGIVYCHIARGGRRRDIPEPVTNVHPTSGYVTGAITVNAEKVCYRAHRVIWLLVHSDIPEGFEIDHWNRIRHDNRLNNLRLVTYSDQMRNVANKGGSSPRAMLTDDQAEDIRRRRTSGEGNKRLAIEYSPSTISMITKGRTYRPEAEIRGYFR